MLWFKTNEITVDEQICKPDIYSSHKPSSGFQFKSSLLFLFKQIFPISTVHVWNLQSSLMTTQPSSTSMQFQHHSLHQYQFFNVQSVSLQGDCKSKVWGVGEK